MYPTKHKIRQTKNTAPGTIPKASGLKIIYHGKGKIKGKAKIRH